MRLIDADKINPDIRTQKGMLGISQGQLAYAPTVSAIPISVIEEIKADIAFERDRKLGGEAFEAVQYKSFNKAIEIIDRHLDMLDGEPTLES